MIPTALGGGFFSWSVFVQQDVLSDAVFPFYLGLAPALSCFALCPQCWGLYMCI